MSDIVILKYNAGNVCSVRNAMERIGVQALVTDDKEVIQSAKALVFPGVGHAASAMAYLRERNLDALLVSLRQPVLGICLGMQLMCMHSEEGDTKGLGIFNVPVLRFPDEVPTIPHMGWNTLSGLGSALTSDLPEEVFQYFVHSYYVPLSEWTIAKTQFGIPFSAALHRDNFYAAQFHPEKSGLAGEQLLKNFVKLSAK